MNGFIEWIKWEEPQFSQAPLETTLTYDKDKTKFSLF
jgi:hypothetical protein